MRELTTRSISGIVYAAAIIGAVSFHPYGLLALLAIFLTAGLVELRHLIKATDVNSLFSTLNVLGIFLLWAHLRFSQDYQNHLMAFFVIILIALLSQWLFTKQESINTSGLQKVLFATIYILLPLSVTINIAFIHGYWQPHILLAIFFFLWANDTFAYLTGRAIGKHKLIPRLSPKKTIEGLIGGIVGSLIVAHFIAYIWHDLSLWNWIILSVLVALAGNVGDLFESALKRAAGVKDSGNLIPGHGGILDRVDSFLFSAPVAYFYLHFFG